MSYVRKTCAVCGQENVPHTKSGGPIWHHTHTHRHYLGVISMRAAARAALEREPVTAWCPHEPCSAASREHQIVGAGATPKNRTRGA